MEICVTARAGATVANQPSFDLGGFPIKLAEIIAGKAGDWETLQDLVSISVGEELPQNAKPKIDICNLVEEDDAPELPTEAKMHTAGRLIEAAIVFLESNGIQWRWPLSVRVEKGISVKGTGLGSSGATPAAALRAFEEIMRKLDIQYVFGDHTKAQLLMNADQGVPDNSIPSYFGNLVETCPQDGEVTVEKIVPGDDFGHFVLVTPQGFGIKTSDARRALEGVKVHDSHEEDVRKMQEAIKNGDTKAYGEAMESAHRWFVGPRSRLYPHDGGLYDQVYDAARNTGAAGVSISGAGPTMIAVVEDRDKAWEVGEAMYQAFQKAGFDSVARLVEIDSLGACLI